MFPLETFPDHLASIQPEDWDKLFQFLPQLELPEEPDHWNSPVPGFSEVAYSPTVVSCSLATEILKALYDLELIISYDWGAWTEGSRRLAQEPFTADDLDAVTICKMITGIVRSDGFNKGSLAHAFQDGRMPALLISLEAQVSAV